MSVRRWLALGAALASAAGFVMLPVRADDANRECDNNQDVTVAVDFNELGGGVNVRCAPQPIKSGFEALQRADIRYEQSGGFVCRIAGEPESAPCTDQPPSGPYWAYWYAPRGGQWKYSNYGAGARKPPAGSIDGWSFSDGNGPAEPPRYPVPAPIVETTSPPPVATTTADRPAPGATVATRATAPTTAVTSTSAVALSVPTVSVTTTRSTVVALGDVDLSSDGGDGGTSRGFVASVVVLALLGAAGLAVARRRSSA
ncbi:MAG: hypothetical protein QOI61_787 [Actinomycetota bacterium]